MSGNEKTSNLSHKNLKPNEKNQPPFGVFISAEKQRDMPCR